MIALISLLTRGYLIDAETAGELRQNTRQLVDRINSNHNSKMRHHHHHHHYKNKVVFVVMLDHHHMLSAVTNELHQMPLKSRLQQELNHLQWLIIAS